MDIEHGASVLVTDGSKALLLRNEGDARFSNLRLIDKWEHVHEADRDLKSDAPGRSFGSYGHGSRRSAYGEADRHEAAEADFLADLAARLGTRFGDGEVRDLVIVAPPRALGEFRKHLQPAVRQAVQAEIGKDLVKHPVAEIEKLLAHYA